MLGYLFELGPVLRDDVIRRTIERLLTRRPARRLTDQQTLKALSQRRLGLVRFTPPQAS